MRTDTARPVRLKDYRPPDWLVESVDLDVSLHPTKTRVRSGASAELYRSLRHSEAFRLRSQLLVLHAVRDRG